MNGAGINSICTNTKLIRQIIYFDKSDLFFFKDQLTTVGNSNHSVKHMSSLEDDFSDIKSFGAYECGSLSSLSSSSKVKQATNITKPVNQHTIERKKKG